jgi:hypothetical protein
MRVAAFRRTLHAEVQHRQPRQWPPSPWPRARSFAEGVEHDCLSLLMSQSKDRVGENLRHGRRVWWDYASASRLRSSVSISTSLTGLNSSLPKPSASAARE